MFQSYINARFCYVSSKPFKEETWQGTISTPDKGSASAATMPPHRQQAVLEAPMPVSQNAPLEERMYPASVADVVKRHAQGDHSTLQLYSPDPDAAVPYYRMGG